MTAREPSFGTSVKRTSAFNAAYTGLGAITGVLLARWLGPDGRGEYAALSAWFGLSLIVFELGIAGATVYFVSRARHRAADYVRTALVLLTVMGLGTASLTVVGLVLLGKDSAANSAARYLIAVCILLSFLGAPAVFALQAVELHKWNVVRALQPALYLCLVVAFAMLVTINLGVVILALTISIAIQAGVAWIYYRRGRSGPGRADRVLAREMLHFGLRNMASTAPNALNGRFDQLVLAFVVPASALGQYAVAVSLSLLAGPLAAAFGHVAFPHLARGEGDPVQTIRRSARGAAGVAVLGVGSVVLLAPFVTTPLFGTGYEEVPKILFLLAPGAVCFIVNAVLGDLLRGLGRPAVVARAEWSGAAATIVGLLLTVPLLGVLGAALTSSFVYAAVFALLAHSLRRALREQEGTQSQP